MVHMMRGSIHIWFQYVWYSVIAVMYRNGPNVNEYKQCQICYFMQWEQERVYMIGKTLKETIHGMKGMACKRRGNFPFMVVLVKSFVDTFMMEEAVDPINEPVCKHYKRHHLYHNSSITCVNKKEPQILCQC